MLIHSQRREGQIQKEPQQNNANGCGRIQFNGPRALERPTL